MENTQTSKSVRFQVNTLPYYMKISSYLLILVNRAISLHIPGSPLLLLSPTPLKSDKDLLQKLNQDIFIRNHYESNYTPIEKDFERAYRLTMDEIIAYKEENLANLPLLNAKDVYRFSIPFTPHSIPSLLDFDGELSDVFYSSVPEDAISVYNHKLSNIRLIIYFKAYLGEEPPYPVTRIKGDNIIIYAYYNNFCTIEEIITSMESNPFFSRSITIICRKIVILS